MFENATYNTSSATVSTTSKTPNDLHLVPGEASQNQKLINMINDGIDKFNSNNNNYSNETNTSNKLSVQVDINNNSASNDSFTNKNLDSVNVKS